MQQKKVIVCFQDQKPLGTRKEDFELSLYSCYKPLLTFLYTNPEVKIALYFSGVIYEWLESEYPEINMLIADMVKRHQIELLTGGYYDPIFHLIPSKDRTLQIEKLTTYLRKRFGSRPRTAWVSEQVFNPSLVGTLSMCGITSIIQQTERKDTGNDPFIMQELGHLLKIYPVDRTLSDSLIDQASSQFAHQVEVIHKLPEREQLTIVLDMNRLLSTTMLQEHNSTLNICNTIKEVVGQKKLKMILPCDTNGFATTTQGYLPSGWYSQNRPEDVIHYNEMLIRYPELKRMYGKMLYVSKLIPGIKKERSLKKIASRELLKAQSFGSYTISQNGGLYQNFIRKRNYSHLVEVEKITREKGVFATSITSYDVDLDGRDEYIYRGKNITSVFDAIGGTVTELDYLVNSWNYLDTFVGHSAECSRRSIEDIPCGHEQNSFIDLLVSPLADTQQLSKYSDPHITSYEHMEYSVERVDKDKKQLSFSYTDQQKGIRITKIYICHTNTIQVDYCITNISNKRVTTRFGSELNISFPFDTPELLQMSSEDLNHTRQIDHDSGGMKNVKLLKIRDNHKKAIVSLFSSKRYHLQTRSYNTTVNTLLGQEEIYQYTRILPIWELDMKASESWDMTLSLRIEKMK